MEPVKIAPELCGFEPNFDSLCEGRGHERELSLAVLRKAYDAPYNARVNACQAACKDLWDGNMDGVANYRVVDINRNVVRTTNTACIADIMNYRTYGYHNKVLDHSLERIEVPPRNPMYIVYALGDCFGGRKEYLKWLTQESALKDVYVMQEFFNVDTDEPCVVINAMLPSSVIGLAANILRLGLENEFVTDGFSELSKAGVNNNLAFLASGILDEVNSSLCSFGDYKFVGHSVIGRITTEKLVEVFCGNREVLQSELYAKHGTYRVREAINAGDNDVITPLLEDLVPEVIKKSAKKDLLGRVTSPAVNAKGYSSAQLNTVWEKLLVKYGKAPKGK